MNVLCSNPNNAIFCRLLAALVNTSVCNSSVVGKECVFEKSVKAITYEMT